MLDRTCLLKRGNSTTAIQPWCSYRFWSLFVCQLCPVKALIYDRILRVAHGLQREMFSEIKYRVFFRELPRKHGTKLFVWGFFCFVLLFNNKMNFGHLNLSFHSAALRTRILQMESRRHFSLRCHPILNPTPRSVEYWKRPLSTLTSFRFRKRRSLFLSRKPGRKRNRSGCHRCSTGTSQQGRN